MKTIAMRMPALARAIAAGEVSAREALAASIACIEATDARVNAFTGRTFERAQAEADAVDAARAAGQALPPLAGVPYAVKNLFDVEGVVTLAGSKINRGHALDVEEVLHRIGHAGQWRQRLAGGAGGVDRVGFGSRALERTAGEGVGPGVGGFDAGDAVSQRFACAHFPAGDRTRQRRRLQRYTFHSALCTVDGHRAL